MNIGNFNNLLFNKNEKSNDNLNNNNINVNINDDTYINEKKSWEKNEEAFTSILRSKIKELKAKSRK